MNNNVDLLNADNLDTNVSGMFSNMYGRKRYSNRDAKYQPFVMYRNADGEVVLSSEPILVAPAESTITTSPTRSSTTTETVTLTPTETVTAPTLVEPAPTTTIVEPTPTRSQTVSEPITLTPTPIETVTAPTLVEPPPTRSSTIEPVFTLNPIVEPAPTPRSVATSENVSLTPTVDTGSFYSPPRTVSEASIVPQPIIINNAPAPTSIPVSTSAIPRPSGMGMPMGGGGGGGVAPKSAPKEAPKETAKATSGETAKTGMSMGAKLAVVGLLAVGGYFAWKYKDMIFKQ